jgi:hypothetical protein
MHLPYSVSVWYDKFYISSERLAGDEMVELLKQRITVVRNVKKVGVNIHRLCMM